MKIKGFIVRLIISLIVAFPVLYWCRNIMNETSTSDVLFMVILAICILISLVIAWLVYPLFKR